MSKERDEILVDFLADFDFNVLTEAGDEFFFDLCQTYAEKVRKSLTPAERKLVVAKLEEIKEDSEWNECQREENE